MGRLTEESQGFKPDPGNPAVRDYRGASGNVAMVEMRSRLAYRKSESGNPPPTAGAPELYPNHSIETGESFEFVHRFRRADGVYHWHLSRAHAMRDVGGERSLWIG